MMWGRCVKMEGSLPLYANMRYWKVERKQADGLGSNATLFQRQLDSQIQAKHKTLPKPMTAHLVPNA